MSTTAWPAAKPAGASSARRCAAPIRATRSARRTGSTRWRCEAATARSCAWSARSCRCWSPRRIRRHCSTALCDPAIRIVTLTITEKAYLRNAAGGLDAAHPDIVHDLANPGRPRTAHGFLTEALARRRARGNPAVHRALLRQSAGQWRDAAPGDARLRRACAMPIWRATSPTRWRSRRAWWTASCRPPPTATADRIAEALGLDDAWPVMTEPFCQWVVEDRFPAGRPAWEKFGVTMVADVRPFEEMKLRLLNGSHSAIAYLGLLSGHATVAEAFADPAIRGFVERLWREAIPTLPAGAGLDPQDYVKQLAARYDNAALAHQTRQIANDGSQKLPQRIVATALERLRDGAAGRASGAGRRSMDRRLRGARRDAACRAFHRSAGRAARCASCLADSGPRAGRCGVRPRRLCSGAQPARSACRAGRGASRNLARARAIARRRSTVGHEAGCRRARNRAEAAAWHESASPSSGSAWRSRRMRKACSTLATASRSRPPTARPKRGVPPSPSVGAFLLPPTSTRSSRTARIDAVHGADAAEHASRADAARRRGRQARAPGKASGDHARAGAGAGRGGRRRRRHARRRAAASLPAGQHGAGPADGRRASRRSGVGLGAGPQLAATKLLRPARPRHQGARRRRRAA